MTNKKTESPPPISPQRVGIVLLMLDLFGLLAIFNFSHWYFIGIIPENLLLSRKLLVLVVTTVVIFYILDLYSLQSKVIELATIARTILAVGVIGWLMAILIYVSGPKYMGGLLGRGVLSWSLVAFFLWTAIWRYVLSRWLRSLKKSIQWLVIIDKKSIVNFIDDFFADIHDESLLFLIDEVPKNLPTKNDQCPLIVGKWEDVHKFASKAAISGVVVATKLVPEELLLELTKLRLEGIKIYDLNDYYERFLTKMPIFHLKSGWLAMSHGFDLLHNPTGWRIKRMSDIVLAAIIFTISLPIILLCFLLIRLESKGPALYKQQRIGYNAKPFTLYKFRTMYNDAENTNIYTEEDDKRITKIGRILRRMRIDELPQMYNVIKGEMSLIGPRAEWIECVKQYENVIPFYHYRHLIKPGITGWAQVLYPYGSSVDDARIKLQYDLYYIKNYSIILDMVIVLKTIRVIIFGKGR